MSGEEIGLFMIGCGGFARRYHVPVIEEDKAVRLLGICDPVPADAVRAFAARHGAPVVDSIEALPEAEGRLAAIVTTPHTLHAGHVQATLDARLAYALRQALRDACGRGTGACGNRSRA